MHKLQTLKEVNTRRTRERSKSEPRKNEAARSGEQRGDKEGTKRKNGSEQVENNGLSGHLKKKGDTMKKYLYSKDGETWERKQAAAEKEFDPGDIGDFDFDMGIDLDFSFLNDIEI